MTDSTATVADTLAKRLGLYGRYLAIAGEEVEALGAENGERLRLLKVERSAIEEEIAALDARDPDGADEGGTSASGIEETLLHALEMLDERADAEQQTAERWSRINSDAIRSARDVPPAFVRSRSYPDLEARNSKLDVRL